MQIVIPMSGIGKRFIDAGYDVPKPLIEMDGIPIIEHVVNMFPGETNFTFICNSDHLKTTNMRSILERIAPQGNIVEIAPHKKGPVYAVTQINDLLHDDEEIIVNYCDFSMYWDYNDFLRHTRERDADGAIPAYKGFHPHMLGTTNYAFMRDDQQWMLEIKEKEPFTDNRMEEYASVGTYYFKKAAYVKKYFQQLIDEDINLNGEYYISLVYNLLIRDQLKVSIYDVQHMLQWGTPQDVQEYNTWSNYFASITKQSVSPTPIPNSALLMPLAGAGSRFVKEGYEDPKPLISVSGKPMIIQAVQSLPTTEQHVFLCQKAHLNQYPLEAEIKKVYPNATVVTVESLTEGQASTCELGLPYINPEQPLLIGACDNGMVWNQDDFDALINDPTTDAVIFSFRHHVSSERNPQMYGWIDTDATGKVKNVSVKQPISDDPFNDHAVVGSFYFKHMRIFQEALTELYAKNIRINNEFYVDSLMNEVIALGYNVKVFELDQYVGWGTPNDLRTYEYWQSFFHKWPWHDYKLENDVTLNPAALETLTQRYTDFEQENQ
ncbi:NTP transferase domain-containing protein [Paenibacillus campi]|uniref:NTP transferase domain-containing protein n=1 Tax=Paenibacillus campi TaxID=3106031 RepID=UPI002AFFBF45|nr:sugar phosphate nucleotidyltransferase [Paenibacillus sp. SGZ-1014]